MQRSIFSLVALSALAWAAPRAHAQLVPLACDADNNGVIDKRDIAIIMADRNTAASGQTDPRDPNRDGIINVLDSGFCATQCTFAACAIVPSPPPPIAKAGRDQIVASGATVELDGTGSTSARGDSITFSWSIASAPGGSAAALSDSSAPRPTFVADQDGLYQLKLIVTDAHGVASPPSLVNVAAGPGFSVGPVANAGTYPIASVGTPVTLDGSQSTDVSGAGPLLYSWSIKFGPVGTSAFPSNGGGLIEPDATLLPDLFGQYYLQLTVTDANAKSSTSKVAVDTQPHYLVPVAVPGVAREVQQGEAVQLDGTGSFDPDGSTIAAYQWTLLWKPPGSNAQLSAGNTAQPGLTADQPGDYVVQLVVTANGLTSVPSTILISTNEVPPRASAGADQSVYVGDTATVNGTGTAAGNESLAYRWSLLATPANTGGITLNGAQTPAATFVPNEPGTYVAQLIVNDGHVDSVPAVTHVQAVTPTTADLALSETASTTTPPIGGTVALTLTATDLGPLSATSASVSDVLPSGLSFVSASNSSYNPATGIWTTGGIPRNSAVAVTLYATVLASGSYTNTATITASTPPDPKPANNSASVTLTPVPAATLDVSAAVSNAHPVVGSDVTFTITVSNTGTVAASGTSVADLLPSGLTFVSATSSTGSYNSSTGQWSIGSLAPGASVTLTVTALVNSAGSFANAVTVAGDNVVSGAAGTAAQVSVTPPPTVSITTPADGSRFIAPASYPLGITVASPAGVIAQIAIYDGASLLQTLSVRMPSTSYTLNFSGLGAGTHAYSVVATDLDGNTTTSNTVNVTIVAPTARAALLFPTQNAFFVAPATVTLLASAASSTGSVSQVEFFQDGVSVGTATEPHAPYSITLTGVAAGTHLYTVAVTDSTSTVTSSAVTVTVGSAATLTVTSPQPGASVASDVVAVAGSVQAPPNSSLTVGGVPATIAADGSFTANDVPLQSGANSIPVILTEPDGNQTTQTLSVTSTGSRPFRFSTYTLGVDSSTSGLPPLSVEFAITDVAQVAASRVDLSCLGDGTVNQSTSGLDTSGGATPVGTCVYSQPGVYTAEATVVDSSSGQDQVVYTATQTIVVTDPSALDALLRSQWSGMNDALLAGDSTRALGYLDSSAQTVYAPVFSELASAMPGIIASYSDLTPVRQTGTMAEYVLTRTIQGAQQAFIITFVNVEGVWQLDMM